MIGIYKITNPKGKIYIGQSIDIESRFKNYKCLGCKNQSKLYNSLKKYGYDNHFFEVLMECNKCELNKNERYYQILFNSVSDNGLNCKLVEDSENKSTYSFETKLKMSNSAKLKTFTKEHRLNMSKSRKGKDNPMFGRKHTELTKKIISEKNKNKSTETRIKQSESAKKRPKEFYENLSIKLKGMIPPNAKIVLNIETGIYYNSVAEASRTIEKGKGSSTLNQKLSGERRNNTNFIYA